MVVPSWVLEEPWRNVITTSRDEFARAVRLHQAGDLGVAARLYESVLASVPTHADALHLLGVVRHQQGQHSQAADLIGKALALRPHVAVYHASMAEVHRARGQLEEAVARGCEAIRLGLDEPGVRNNLGLALHVLGRHAEAAGAFLAVLESRPDDALAHTNLGAALRELGDNERALEHMSRAARLAPSSRRRETISANSCSNWAVPTMRSPIARPPSPCSPKWRKLITTWATSIAH